MCPGKTWDKEVIAVEFAQIIVFTRRQIIETQIDINPGGCYFVKVSGGQVEFKIVLVVNTDTHGRHAHPLNPTGHRLADR